LPGWAQVAAHEIDAEWSPARVLLCEDDLDTALALRDRMRPIGFSTNFLATPTQLRKNPQTCAIPVVFMTARAQTRESEHFIALGAEGVISKPFDPMTLAVAVQRQLQALHRI